MLQILADFSAEPITALYNKPFQSGEVPQDWRKAIICPIFKNREPEDAAVVPYQFGLLNFGTDFRHI